jgi:hypothetical protein
MEENRMPRYFNRMPRYFKAIYRSNDGTVVSTGRYCGIKPKQAASKALNAIIKSTDGKVNQPVKFLITECTRGSKKKCYSYSGEQREITPVPVEIKRKDGGSTKIFYTKCNYLHKIAFDDCRDIYHEYISHADPEAPDEKDACHVVL